MTKEDIAKIIKTRRQAKGISQAELARRLGIFRQNVLQWEKGLVEPKASTMFKILQITELNNEEKKNIK